MIAASAPVTAIAETERIASMLRHAVAVCGSDRGDVITTLLGVLATICLCSSDGEELWQLVQEELAHVRTRCVAATASASRVTL